MIGNEIHHAIGLLSLGLHRARNPLLLPEMPAQRVHARGGLDALTRNKPMPDLRYDFAKEFGCQRGPDAQFNDKCQLSYDLSGEEMLGIVPPARKPDHERTLGDLAQYEALFALCTKCNRRKPIDRWDIQRKVGKKLTLGAVAGLMRCKCGHKGARLMVRHLSRD